MTRTENTSTDWSEDPYESDTLPSLGLGWPEWVVEHLIKLFKRATKPV
jgi:glycyl-tRNA synthetase alpha subunit